MKDLNLNWKQIQLVKKYQFEGLHPEEHKVFNHWKATDREFAQAIEELSLRKSWKKDLEQLDRIDEDAAWDKFSKKNFLQDNTSKSSSFGTWYRLVAAFIGIMIFSSIWWTEVYLQKADEQAPIPAGYYSNKLGKVTAFLLPDSTKVWLSTGSELRYEVNFTSNRKVRLNGEAFFEVRKNPDFPFEIVTDELVTKVLGTSFNLKAYAGEGIDLSVYSGKVQFGRNDEQTDFLYLIKNQKISWRSSFGFSEIKAFDSSREPDWKTGVFRFEGAKIEEIVKLLSKWYPVEFLITDDSGGCNYSGEFHRSSLEQVLEILSYTLNLNYEIHENTVRLKPNPC